MDDVINRTAQYLCDKVSDKINMYMTLSNIANNKRVDNKKLQSIYQSGQKMKNLLELCTEMGYDLPKLIYEGGNLWLKEAYRYKLDEALGTDKSFCAIQKMSVMNVI